jgi:ADP-ribose pyrophosphatase YjhB (NUDIX family)
MNYCSSCGATVTVKIPEGDNLPRHVCDACGEIHYRNPKIVAGCVAVWEDRVLLCRRAIEPRYGLWTVPAGFMENGETTDEAASRETWEEARAAVAELTLYGVFSIPHISQVYMMFRGRMNAMEFDISPESLEVRLCEENEIPWDRIAFPVVRETLTRYFADRVRGSFPVHVQRIAPSPGRR